MDKIITLKKREVIKAERAARAKEVGSNVENNVIQSFRDLRTRQYYRYCIYKFNDDYTAIQVDKLGSPNKTWEDFKNDVPRDSGRYLLYDL